MNFGHPSTVLRPARDSGHPRIFPGRAARLMGRGPATMTSPAARWIVNVLALTGPA